MRKKTPPPIVHVRVTPSELRLLRAAARRRKETVSDTVRYLMGYLSHKRRKKS